MLITKPLAAELSSKKCGAFNDEPDPDSKYQEICMDRVFNLKHQVLAVIDGSYEDPIIESIDFYHYRGLPDHMVLDPACTLFENSDYGYIHVISFPVEKRGPDRNYVCDDSILDDSGT